jgi:hypothetical protein
MAALCLIGCKHWDARIPIECPPLSDEARAELESACGADLEQCQAFGHYLSEVEAMCRANAL